MLCREHHGGVARVYTSILHVLRDGIFDDLALVGHGIKLNLLGLRHKLRHHHGELLRHLGSHVEEALQLLLVVAHVHRSTREHVRRTHQNGIAHLVDKLLDVVEACQRTPSRLVDAQFVEHSRELVAVLCTVDIHGRGTQYGHTLTMQLHGQVVGNLTTHADDDATGLLQVHHVEHALQRELVEIEAVAHVIVGRHGLGVIVNHDRLIAQFASRVDGVHRTPVELHARADAIGTRAQHHHRLLVVIIGDVVSNLILLALRIAEGRHVRVGKVQIVCQLRMFRGHGGDALY